MSRILAAPLLRAYDERQIASFITSDEITNSELHYCAVQLFNVAEVQGKEGK
jgi:hypothetical protein